MHRAGLPTPDLQPELLIGGQFWIRPDFCWKEQRTIGEFDGLVKYGKGMNSGLDPTDVLVQEKLREDRIRSDGWEVVRWTWTDLDKFGAVADQIRAAFERGLRRAA